MDRPILMFEIDDALVIDVIKRESNLSFLQGKPSDWGEKFSNEELKKIVIAIKKLHLEDRVRASFIPRDKDDKSNYTVIEFEYDDLLKKVFIDYLFMIYQRKQTIWQSIATFIDLQKYGIQFQKSLLDFTESEMRETIKDLYREAPVQIYRLKQRISLLAEFQNYYSELSDTNASWEKMSHPDNMTEIIREIQSSAKIIEEEELISIAKKARSIQDGIVPLLIYLGVKARSDEKENEIVWLKKNGFTKDSIKISGKNAREIPVSEEVIDLLRLTATTGAVYVDRNRSADNEFQLLELKDTPYLIRGLQTKRGRTNGDTELFTNSGIIKRINVMSKIYCEEYGTKIPFTKKVLEKHGRLSSINKFIGEGFSKDDAVIKTLQRFGEWESNNEKDPSRTDLTRIHRLKKEYDVFKK